MRSSKVDVILLLSVSLSNRFLNVISVKSIRFYRFLLFSNEKKVSRAENAFKPTQNTF